jgi:site-specific DNA recombinase
MKSQLVSILEYTNICNSGSTDYSRIAEPNSRLTGSHRWKRQVKNVEERQHRLLDAIGSGVVELDETAHQPSWQLKTARETLLIQIAEARKAPLPPAVEFLKPGQVEVLEEKLRKRLLPNAFVVKNSIQMLVDEVTVHKDEAIIRGSHLAQASALHQMQMGTSVQVPTLIYDWRARQESNL